MNEHEFEQHYTTALKVILPTFQESSITSQKSFSIKFGHRNVNFGEEIPGNRAKLGIYDILLSIDNRPLVMLELKRPGLKLTNDDRDQGISYARLTNPITPITIVTNGKEFNVYDTYTKDKIDDKILNEDFFTKRLEQASMLSKNEFKNSIITLVENDQRVLFDLLNTISETTFDELIGSDQDVTKPIVTNFCIPREKLADLIDAVDEHQFVVLTGDAYSGKTNLLYQYYKKAVAENEAVLYINCIDFQYSIFRKLTNNIHGLLQFPIDEIKLKEWLLLEFAGDTKRKITIIFDHVRYNIDRDMMADISEIVDLFKMDGNKIILCADRSNYLSIKRNNDRVLNTLIGNNFYEVELENFSSDELFVGNEMIYNNFNAVLSWGSNYTDSYRVPRIWRLLINDIKKEPLEDHIRIIDSVPGFEILEIFKSTFQLDDQSVSDFVKLIQAFIDGIEEIHNEDLKLLARNMAIINENKALLYLDEKKIERLIYAGYLDRRLVSGFDWVLVVKLPEFLAGHAVESLKTKYIEWLKSDFESAYKSFIKVCEFMPYGELVACRFIHEIGFMNEIELFSDIAARLVDDEPYEESSTSEMKAKFYSKELKKNIQINVEEGTEYQFLINSFPHLVLAHFLDTNIIAEDDNSQNKMFRLIGDLANKPYLIRKPDTTLLYDGLPTYNMGRIGEVVASNLGIVEPITKVLFSKLIAGPAFFESFYNHAIANKRYQLLHRIYIAAKNGISMQIATDLTLDLCNKIVREYEALLPEVLAFALAEDKDNDEELKKIKDRIIALKKSK